MSVSNITILVIEKNGDVREHVVKTFDESELYKKAGFKTSEGFKSHTEWNIENLNDVSYNISVYGKTNGRANQENKYEFPPPIDNTLFFGSCVLVNKVNGKPVNLRAVEWDSIYEYLYGGFDDIGNEDEEDEDSEENDLPLNKYGYAKDGFVVDDDEDAEDDYETEEEDQEDEDGEMRKKGKNKKNKKNSNLNKKSLASIANKKSASKKSIVEIIQNETIDNKLECTSELSEESYLE